MPILQDTKYIRLISSRLLRFTNKGQNVYNFRCPVCGDSEKDKLKARAYFYPYKNNMVMKCHNCGGLGGGVTSFGKFLQWFDQKMYKDYQMDMFEEKLGKRPKKLKVDKVGEEYKLKRTAPVFEESHEDESIFKTLVPVSELPEYHFCYKYVLERKIPKEWWSNLFYAKDFKNWVNEWKPGKFSAESLERGDRPRLVIALNNENGWTTTIQGRDLTGESYLKYYSIKVAEDEENVFGLDKLNFDARTYILEGPIDSMFIPNAIAVGSSALKVPTKYRTKIKDYVLVFDNEPRNKDICKIIHGKIKNGERVYLPPMNAPYKKDINDWVMDTGISGEEIAKFIDENTYQGLSAELYFNKWKKV